MPEDIEEVEFTDKNKIYTGIVGLDYQLGGDFLTGMSKKRGVVDSLSSFIRENGVDAAIGLMKDAAEKIAQTGGNVLFLLYDGVHSPVDEIAVIRYADVYIHLIEERHGNEIELKMEISKLKFANIPNRMYPYDITHEGIDLSTTARVV